MLPPDTIQRAGRVVIMSPRDHFPREQEIRDILDYVAEVVTQIDQPPLFCSMPGAGPPPPEVRQALMAATPELLSHCQAMHLVVHHSGVSGSLLRTAFRTMLLIQGLRSRIFVHSSIDEFEAATEEPEAAALLRSIGRTAAASM